jgi:hypothetical protein
MFIVNSNASIISNITSQNVLDLYATGSLGLNFFTGQDSDTNTMVNAVGRYYLSGTRITTQLDAAGRAANLLGITTSTFKQYGLSADGSTVPGLDSSDSSSPPGYAATATTGLSWISVQHKGVINTDGGGYFTGGNVGKAIDASTVSGASSSLAGAIAYIAPSDSAKLIYGTSEGPIAFNGQVPWVGGTFPCTGHFNTNGVMAGAYTFWTYERLYTLDSSTSFQVNCFGPALITAIQYEITHLSGWGKFYNPNCSATPNYSPTAVLESQMNVYRNADGGDVFLNP